MSEELTHTEKIEAVSDGKAFFSTDGKLIKLDELTEPFYSQCKGCAIQSRCPVFETDSHCRLEEAMVIEATRNLTNDQSTDVTVKFKLTLNDFLINLVLQHRLQRVGASIDYNRLGGDPRMLDLLKKYVDMTTAVSRRYMEGLKEMAATPREVAKYNKSNQSSGYMIISQHMSRVLEEEAKEASHMETIKIADTSDR